MNNITIFTLNVYNNNYLHLEPSKFCMQSWYKLVDSIKNCGKEVNIKIYTCEDKDFKDYYNLCKDYVDHNNSKPQYIADGFRMYILSKYKNHLWLDSDVYFHDNFKFEDKFLFSHHWCFLYNKTNIKFFKNIFYNFYANKQLFIDNPQFYDYNDRQVTTYFNEFKEKPKMLSNMTHMSFVNNLDKNRIKICYNPNSDFNDFDFDGILVSATNEVRAKFLNLFGLEKTKKYVRNLKGNTELISYVEQQFPQIKIIK